MKTKKLRVYADTSVFGGYFDPEFSIESIGFFKRVKSGDLILLLSDIVIAEINVAPGRVKELMDSLSISQIEAIETTKEILELRNAYLKAGIIGPKWSNDAAHVASATINRADAIVSWNFKHIVRLDKMKAYNQVNLAQGYGIITIITPKEVLTDD